jgi:Ca-activated chloride channel homolog
MRARCLSIVLLVFMAWPVMARDATDANLITAIDVSGSVRAADERLELEGMAQAVVDPKFLQAIARGYHGQIGFVVFTWANGEFIPLVPWTLIGTKDEAEQVAGLLRSARGVPAMGYAPRMPGERRPWRIGHATDVSAAIERAIELSATAPFDSWHTVLNICANGIDNVGDGPAAARDRANGQGLIVNGLILGDRGNAAEVATYFRDHVQAGPGSFVMEAREFQDVTRAMLSKFLVELAALRATAQAQLR